MERSVEKVVNPIIELLAIKSEVAEVRESVAKHDQVNKLNKEKLKVMEARLDRMERESKAANIIISNVSVGRSAEDAAGDFVQQVAN